MPTGIDLLYKNNYFKYTDDSINYHYDDIGNVVRIECLGESGSANDDIDYYFEYAFENLDGNPVSKNDHRCIF